MAEPTEGSASLLSDRYKLKSIIKLIIQIESFLNLAADLQQT